MTPDRTRANRVASTAPVWQRAPAAVRGELNLLRATWLYGWQLAALGSHVAIGPGCRFINGHRTAIGDGCQLRGPARLEVVLLDDGPEDGPVLTLGSRVTIEQNVHIIASRGVRIGDAVSISANVSIVDVTHPPYDGGGQPAASHIVASDAQVVIGDGVFIGVGAVVLPGVEIGEGARIGANAVVTRSVQAYTSVAGVPARPLS